MMSAFRSWETLFLFVTSSVVGWTREALAIVTTTTCPNGRVSCPGFGDGSDDKYCCPSPIQADGFYCCSYWEQKMRNGDYSDNIPEIIGGVVGGAFLVASLVVLSCFFCRCCYVYKYRHRKRNGNETVARRPSSTLGWRYRNWPRSNFVPPMSTSCNGTSSLSSSRYYYSNWPFRETAPATAYNRYHHYSAFASSRNRHEFPHRRSQPRHSTGADDCCRMENDNLSYSIRSPTTYTPYAYEPVQGLLVGDTKPFEAPPPYPVAQYYPTCPPIPIPETQMGPGMPAAISPLSTSTSATTSSTVIQEDLLQAPVATNADCDGNKITNSPVLSTPGAPRKNDTADLDGFVIYDGYSPKRA